MPTTPAKPRPRRKFSRWIAKRQEDLFVLAGCALVLFGTWQVMPPAVPFVAGAMCIVWSVVLSIGGRG